MFISLSGGGGATGRPGELGRIDGDGQGAREEGGSLGRHLRGRGRTRERGIDVGLGVGAGKGRLALGVKGMIRVRKGEGAIEGGRLACLSGGTPFARRRRI